TPPIPTGIKMPINPPEISQATAALSDVKAAAQKVDSENAPSELRDTSQKIPKTSVSAVPSGTGKYIPDTELELANLRAEVIEFREQIDALKAKREEDKNRIQELERVKIQLSQVEENRRRIRQQAAELQRESAQLKTQVIDGEKSGVFCRQTNTSNINDSVFLSPSNNNSMNNIRRGIDDANNKTTGTMNRTPNRDMGGLKPPSLNAGMDSGNNMLTDKPVGSSIGRHNSMRSLAASNRPTSLSRTASVRRDRDSGLISKALGYMFGWS
ncbi:unnamed protein product, partial [Trichobilharzia szidati]